MTKINLHIEELSLPGYTPAERREFIAALERELAGNLANAMQRESLAEKHGEIRVSTPDLRPQSVARSTVQSLSLGASKETTK